ncbi:hypothetical protein [uncultured Pseudacidovorax sp.]|uniref:hypothetical protein n=1 Tax=uncultured Pseudacidovorax sp. TaxID=679313 RepID=UPI0025ED010F|nr:hypothetical protein [uncultured Pseudacidovorax sp.]
MKRLLWCFLIASSPVWAQPAAQEDALSALVGTVYTVAHRETSEGLLEACGLEFNVIGRDHATRGGAAVQGIGSYYLRRSGNAVMYALKLGVRDTLGSEGRAVSPYYAFARPVRGSGPRERALRAESETPGYALFVGAVDDEAIAVLKAILEQRRIVVGFNRKAGQQDVSLEIDLAVKAARLEGDRLIRDRSSAMVDDFGACINDLAK